jgi:hypothetical protein
MAYWGTIQQQSAQHADSTAMWDAIKADAAANGLTSPGVTVQGVGEVWAAANRIRNTADTFGKARAVEDQTGFGQSITAQMMTTVPWSREPQVLSTLADYQVRFEALFTTPLGQSASVVLTAKYGAGELPATVGDLVSALGAWAPSSGSLPIGTFDGIGSVSITAV